MTVDSLTRECDTCGGDVRLLSDDDHDCVPVLAKRIEFLERVLREESPRLSWALRPAVRERIK